jgi:hypothetical protein
MQKRFCTKATYFCNLHMLVLNLPTLGPRFKFASNDANKPEGQKLQLKI